jgi:hypothetical protein
MSWVNVRAHRSNGAMSRVNVASPRCSVKLLWSNVTMSGGNAAMLRVNVRLSRSSATLPRCSITMLQSNVRMFRHIVTLPRGNLAITRGNLEFLRGQGHDAPEQNFDARGLGSSPLGGCSRNRCFFVAAIQKSCSSVARTRWFRVA